MSSVSADLKFVTISHPDDLKRRDGVRTDIRRHVMKKIGQERRRPKKQTKGKTPSNSHRSSTTIEADRHVDPLSKETDAVAVRSTPCTPCVRMPILWDFPVEPNDRVVELIRFRTEIEPHLTSFANLLLTFCCLVNEQHSVYLPFRSIWFDIALTDKGAFQVTLGNAADLMLRLRGGSDPDKNPEMLQYYALSVAHLRGRLDCEAERISDGMVAHILSHLCLCMRRGDWTAWKAHIDGLAAIAKARKGLAHLGRGTETYMLLADLGGSMVYDVAPRLALPIYLSPPRKTPLNALPTRLRELFTQSLIIDSSIMVQTAQGLERVFLVAKEVNEKGTSPLFWQQDKDGLHLLGQCIHFLLSMPRLPKVLDYNPGSDELITEMMRLVSLAIMSRLKAMFMFNAPEQAQLEQKLSALTSSYSRQICGSYRDLKIWVLVTAALLHNGASRDVYLNELRYEMDVTGETDAYACVQIAKDFIWFDALGNGHISDLIRDITAYCGGNAH